MESSETMWFWWHSLLHFQNPCYFQNPCRLFASESRRHWEHCTTLAEYFLRLRHIGKIEEFDWTLLRLCQESLWNCCSMHSGHALRKWRSSVGSAKPQREWTHKDTEHLWQDSGLPYRRRTPELYCWPSSCLEYMLGDCREGCKAWVIGCMPIASFVSISLFIEIKK